MPIISNPMSVVESIEQTVFGAAEDEGIMYVAGYALTSLYLWSQAGREEKGVTASVGFNSPITYGIPHIFAK